VTSSHAGFARGDTRGPDRQSICKAFLAAGLLTLVIAGCHRKPAPPEAYLAFVANQQSDTVAVVDLGGLRTIATIAVAHRPSELVVRPRTHEVWTVSSPPGVISVIEFPSLALRKSLPIGSAVRSLAFSADGRTAFVLDPLRGEALILDADGPREIAVIQLGSGHPAALTRSGEQPDASRGEGSPESQGALALTADGKLLVLSAPAEDKLYFVDVNLRKVVASTSVGHRPGPLVILQDGSRALVADTGEQKVTAVDLSTFEVLAHLEIGARPSSMLLKPDGGELFVFSAEDSVLAILDAAQDSVEQSVVTGKNPLGGAFRRDSSVLYVANAGDGSVNAVAVADRSVLASTYVGAEPRALALTPDERFLAVVDAAASSLSIIHAAGAAGALTARSLLVTTVPVGARPVAVVVPDWIRGETGESPH
jgi:YVTN family beta-propeller protein